MPVDEWTNSVANTEWPASSTADQKPDCSGKGALLRAPFFVLLSRPCRIRGLVLTAHQSVANTDCLSEGASLVSEPGVCGFPIARLACIAGPND